MAPGGRPARWRLVTFDLGLLALAYFIYSLVRNAVPGERAAAIRRGSDLLRGELFTGLDPEHGLNHALAAHPVLANIADYYYATFHFIVVLGVLGWLYWRHLEAARRWVYAWLTMNLLALLGFWLLPTAPPRLLPGAGFVDTVVRFHTWGSWADSGVASAANQFAAFPSLHVGWALWSALTINGLARRRWVGRLAFLYPLMTALVVLSTANHYLFDVIAGVLVCLLSFPLTQAVLTLIASARRRLGRPMTPAPTPATTGPHRRQWWKGWRRGELITAVVLVIALVASLSTVLVVVARGRLEKATRRAAGNVASRFLSEWSGGHYAGMAQLAGQPPGAFTTFYRQSAQGLHETAGNYRLKSISLGRKPYAAFTARVTVSGYGLWTYQGALPLAHHGGHWSVAWSPSALYPGLQASDRLALLTSPVTVGHLLDDSGVRIRTADSELTSSVLGPSASDTATPVGLRAQLATELDGRPTGSIAIVGHGRELGRLLFRFTPDPGRNVHTTLDLGLQRLAESVVDTSGLPTSLVAVDTRTGAVKASAGNPAAGGSTAFDGRFPPGSTFKIVTATAALENGYRLDTSVNCPATINGGGFTFHNAGHEVLGRITFEKAFAVSCNTAFVGIAESLPEGALSKAAAFYGCTLRLPTATQRQPLDVPSFACNYPPAAGAEYAASAFGQAAVEVSPLGMTMICAAAETGVWRPPSLLAPGTPGSPPAPAIRRLPAAVSAQLRVAMRAVVTSGTATAISATPVAGKTGTAEYGTGNPLPTHAWFTGYLGHYAVTVLVQDGGYGGSVAAPLAARFLTEAQSVAPSGGVPA